MGPIGVPEVVALIGYSLIGYVVFRVLRVAFKAERQK